MMLQRVEKTKKKKKGPSATPRVRPSVQQMEQRETKLADIILRAPQQKRFSVFLCRFPYFQRAQATIAPFCCPSGHVVF